MIERKLLTSCIKILLLLLIFAFVASGLSGFLQQRNKDYAIKIGNIKYSLLSLNNVLQESSQKFETKSKKNLSYLQSNRLNNIIHDTLVLIEAKKSGIVVDNTMVKQLILNTSIFYNNGIFSKDVFNQILKNKNQSQQNFIKKLKDSIIKSIFIDSVSFYQFNTPGLTRVVLQELFQRRDVELVEIPFSSFNTSYKATNLELNLLYKENKSLFMIPEKRDIEYIVISLDSLRQGNTIIKDAELKKIFDKNHNLFYEPEKRDIKQIQFKSLKDAEYARNQLIQGMSFDIISKRYAPNFKGYDMGFVTSTDFNDQISNILFKLEAGTISQIIQTPSGFYIFKIVDILPQRKKNFEDVKELLKKEYLQHFNFNNFVIRIKAIQKELQQGNNLKSIAQKYSQNLKAITISHAVREGVKITESKIFMDTSFQLALKTQSPLFAIDANNFCVLKVVNISKKRTLTFNQIKQQLQNLWNYSKMSSYIYQMDVHNNSILDSKINDITGIKVANITVFNNQLNNKISLNLHKEIYDLGINHYTKPTINLLKKVIVFARLKNIQFPLEKEIYKYKFLYNTHISRLEEEIMFIDIFKKLKIKFPIIINNNILTNFND